MDFRKCFSEDVSLTPFMTISAHVCSCDIKGSVFLYKPVSFTFNILNTVVLNSALNLSTKPLFVSFITLKTAVIMEAFLLARSILVSLFALLEVY